MFVDTEKSTLNNCPHCPLRVAAELLLLVIAPIITRTLAFANTKKQTESEKVTSLPIWVIQQMFKQVQCTT